MTDLSLTIAPKSDQLNADDLIGGPRTIRITRVSAAPDSAEQPINIFFEGDNGKPFRPCKSMRRVMVQVWGSKGDDYVGRSMTLYRDPEVQFGGMKVGGIRISHMTGIDKPMTMALTATRAKRAPYTVQPLKVQERPKSDGPTSAAVAAARKGTGAFNVYWNSEEGKAERTANRPHMEHLKSMIEAGDTEDDDPFGLPPLPRNDPEPEVEDAEEVSEGSSFDDKPAASGAPEPLILAVARQEAANGTAAARTFWGNLSEKEKGDLEPYRADLQATARAADGAGE